VPEAALPSDDRVRHLADTILARREYAAHRDDLEGLAALAELLRDALARFEAFVAHLAVSQPLAYWALVAGLAGVVLLLLAHLVWSVRAALRTRSAPPPQAPLRRDLVAEAEALAARGRYLEAARRAQHAWLEALVRRGVLDLERDDTNATLRLRLADCALPPAERHQAIALLDDLERQLFRDREDDPALFDAWRGLLERTAPARPGA